MAELTDDSLRVRQLSHYQFSWVAGEPGKPGTYTLQLVLDQGAWEEVLTLDPDDADQVAAVRAEAELSAHWLSHARWADGWDPHTGAPVGDFGGRGGGVVGIGAVGQHLGDRAVAIAEVVALGRGPAACDERRGAAC